MNDKNKKVVNTEEQNIIVNPRGKDYADKNEEAKFSEEQQQQLINSKDNPETEKPDGGSEVERPHPIEGEDADDIERKIPNM